MLDYFGPYDTEGVPPSIVVTGSTKPDTYRKVGDSLGGRFLQFRLHPLDLKEIQIVKELRREKTFPDGAEIRSAHHWLSSMVFLSAESHKNRNRPFFPQKTSI